MRVWLDDAREAPEGWVRARTPDEVINLLRTGKVQELSLDHDLGLFDEEGRELTGYDVLAWIENQLASGQASFEVPTIRVHSANAAVYVRMEQTIASIKRLGIEGRSDE